jgi:hypothetical protein
MYFSGTLSPRSPLARRPGQLSNGRPVSWGLSLKPIAGLTLRTRHDAELALSILAKAGVAVKAAEPEFRDIAVEVLSELEGDDPPWDI